MDKADPDSTITGFVVSDPAGNYDRSKTMPRKDASTICRENGEGWAYGAVFASGRVTFEV